MKTRCNCINPKTVIHIHFVKNHYDILLLTKKNEFIILYFAKYFVILKGVDDMDDKILNDAVENISVIKQVIERTSKSFATCIPGLFIFFRQAYL